MNLTFNKTDIIDFLDAINKVAVDCSVSISNQNVQSLVTNSDGTVILYAKMATANPNIPQDKLINLNIKEIRKLVRVFDCISTDTFEIEIDDNTSVLKFSSKDLSFKLHLVLDEAIKKCSLNLDKINKLTFDTDFVFTGSRLSEILKGSTFATETNKVYFYTKDNQVFAELTDRATEQLDSITFSISDKYNGNSLSTALPFSLDFLRLLSSNKADELAVKINNTYKLLMFEIDSVGGVLKYIVPAYVK